MGGKGCFLGVDGGCPRKTKRNPRGWFGWLVFGAQVCLKGTLKETIIWSVFFGSSQNGAGVVCFFSKPPIKRFRSEAENRTPPNRFLGNESRKRTTKTQKPIECGLVKKSSQTCYLPLKWSHLPQHQRQLPRHRHHHHHLADWPKWIEWSTQSFYLPNTLPTSCFGPKQNSP